MSKISIVTICLNDKNGLERTMQSVLNQKGTAYEYIIKDGGSSDGSLKVINDYSVYFKNKGIRLAVESKSDSGIYDAMNEAIYLCGDTDWIIFLNAGDTFFDTNVISIVSRMIIDDNVAVLMGLTDMRLCKNMSMIEKPRLNESKMTFCHQSTFVRTAIQKRYLFDTSYKIAADRELLLKIRSQKYVIEYINVVVSTFEKNGISSSRYDLLFEETDRIDIKYGLVHKNHRKLVNYIKTALTKRSQIFADLVYIWKRVNE